jgi:hypothetical protein
MDGDFRFDLPGGRTLLIHAKDLSAMLMCKDKAVIPIAIDTLHIKGEAGINVSATLDQLMLEAIIKPWNTFISPVDAAMRTVLAVMWRNSDKGDAWKGQSILEHIEHAISHIDNGTYGGPPIPEREGMENALCRIAMALTIMNGEQDDQA